MLGSVLNHHNSPDPINKCRTSLGCWKDSGETRAISGGARSTPKTYSTTPITDCHEIAEREGWSIFGLQAGGVPCFTAADAGNTYQKHGRSEVCVDGKGGSWASDVYRITECPDMGE